MKEYVATFKSNVQITPNDWVKTNPCLKITHKTTMGEIADWYELKTGNRSRLEINIIELETPKK
ncbi:MAG: hypothetical protein AAGF96_05990 [Bacteroidota bacterium]